MSENQNCWSQIRATAWRCLTFKPGKRGLNSRLRPILWGGSVLTHYLITWLEMDGQLGTRDGSSGRPGALLEMFFSYTNSSTPYLNIYIVFVTGEDDIARYNSRRYTHTWLYVIHYIVQYVCYFVVCLCYVISRQYSVLTVLFQKIKALFSVPTCFSFGYWQSLVACLY